MVIERLAYYKSIVFYQEISCVLSTTESFSNTAMSLDEKFKAACDQIRKFTKKPNDADMLEVYALYKQATIGNCSTEKPADATGKAKWDAWNAKKGVDSTKAKEQYITKVKALAPTYA